MTRQSDRQPYGDREDIYRYRYTDVLGYKDICIDE